MSEQFREKIGLDYLFNQSNAPNVKQNARPQEVDLAFQAIGFRILAILKEKGEANLFDIREQMQIDFRSVQRAADYLSENGLAALLHDDSGNDKLIITDRGRQIPV